MYFREEVPTVARELSVQLPNESAFLNHVEQNGLAKPIVNGATYVWRVDEQPGYLADDLRGHRVLLPNVAFTTAGGGWPEISQGINRRYAAASIGINLPISLERMLTGVGSWYKESGRLGKRELIDIYTRMVMQCAAVEGQTA